MTILNAVGLGVGTGTEAASTLSETFSGTLPAGTYFAQVSSYGGYAQTLSDGGGNFNTTNYFDMGGFFLTGNAQIPEPSTMLLTLACLVGLPLHRSRRKA